MAKQEFLDELKQALMGEVSAEVVMDSYRYYSTYIEDQIRDGKSEEQVLEDLGRPSLIARSIIAAHVGAREVDEIYTEDGKKRRVKNNPFSQNGTSSDKKEKSPKKEPGAKKKFVFDFTAWYAKVLYVLIFFVLVMIVFGLIKVLFWILLHLGIPILIILGIVYLIFYFSK